MKRYMKEKREQADYRNKENEKKWEKIKKNYEEHK